MSTPQTTDSGWRAAMREAYGRACHGAGAEPRRAARQEIEALMRAAGEPIFRLGEVFETLGLDLGAYFASRPIGR